jgi:hypothetical protein
MCVNSTSKGFIPFRTVSIPSTTHTDYTPYTQHTHYYTSPLLLLFRFHPPHTPHTLTAHYTSPLLLAKKTYDGNFDCDATGLLYVVVEYLVVVYAGLLLLLDFTILLLVFTGLLH